MHNNVDHIVFEDTQVCLPQNRSGGAEKDVGDVGGNGLLLQPSARFGWHGSNVLGSVITDVGAMQNFDDFPSTPRGARPSHAMVRRLAVPAQGNLRCR
jgi:hypothetical protein